VGTLVVSPTISTAYTITCVNSIGTQAIKTIALMVGSTPPPSTPPVPVPTLTFRASDTAINPGESVTLTWESANTGSCLGSGLRTGGRTDGSVTVTPTQTTTYRVACVGSTIINRAVTITVGGGAGPIVTLTANPTIVQAGNASTLTWSSTNATKCTSTQFTTNDYSNGTVSVTPANTTTYTVTCEDATGRTATAQALVTVGTAPSVLLTASRTNVPAGTAVTLAWQSGNSTSCIGSSFATGGNTNGSVVVTPTRTTTYSIACINASRATARGSVTVTVGTGSTTPPIVPPTTYACSDNRDNDGDGLRDYPADTGCTGTTDTDETNTPPTTPLPTIALTANPTAITRGDSSVLTWSSTNATACTGLGTTVNGTRTVSPTQTQTYTLTCTGPGGSVSKSVTVSVQTATPINPLAPAPTLTGSVVGSTQINLYWILSGGTSQSFTIERCVGVGCTNFATIGTATKSPYYDMGLTRFTTYTYRVRTQGGGVSNARQLTTYNY
jgi:hypothetical protein